MSDRLDYNSNNGRLFEEYPRLDVRSLNRNPLANSRDNLMEGISAPKDRYKLNYFGFMVLGVVTLLPWNFFITATDYWMFKFRNVTDTSQGSDPKQRTELQTFFESYLAIASNLAMLTTMLLNTIYGQRFSQKIRLNGSLYVILVVFLVTTIFVAINTDQIQDLFFGATMVMVILISSFAAIFQAAIFGVVASFPSECMHAMIDGQAYGGLLAVLVQLLSLARDVGPITSGLWYFLSSTLFLVFAIICYWLMDNQYTRYYINNRKVDASGAGQLMDSRQDEGLISNKQELLATLAECWPFALSVTIIFWATLATFPAVCVLVLPEHPNTSLLTGRFFIPITTFFLFNVADLCGRICSSYVSFPENNKKLLLSLSCARIVIPMLILFCNVHPRYYTSVWFSSDIYYPMFITLSGWTNGYLFSSAMVMSSVKCSKHLTELTGFIMASALGVGLTLGSITSTILLRII